MASGPAKIKLTVLEAEGLRNTQTFGTQDPYVVVCVGRKRIQSKVHEDGGKNPIWQQTLPAAKLSDYRTDKIRFELWNQNSMSDTLIGEAECLAKDLLDGRRHAIDVKYKKKNKGTLFVSATFPDYGGSAGGAAVAAAGVAATSTAPISKNARMSNVVRTAAAANAFARPFTRSSSSYNPTTGTGIGFRQAYRAHPVTATTATPIVAPTGTGIGFRPGYASASGANAARFGAPAQAVTAANRFRAGVGAGAPSYRPTPYQFGNATKAVGAVAAFQRAGANYASANIATATAVPTVPVTAPSALSAPAAAVASATAIPSSAPAKAGYRFGSVVQAATAASAFGGHRNIASATVVQPRAAATTVSPGIGSAAVSATVISQVASQGPVAAQVAVPQPGGYSPSGLAPPPTQPGLAAAHAVHAAELFRRANKSAPSAPAAPLAAALSGNFNAPQPQTFARPTAVASARVPSTAVAIQTLRNVVGPQVPVARLDELLQRAGGDVNEAASLYFQGGH